MCTRITNKGTICTNKCVLNYDYCTIHIYGKDHLQGRCNYRYVCREEVVYCNRSVANNNSKCNIHNDSIVNVNDAAICSSIIIKNGIEYKCNNKVKYNNMCGVHCKGNVYIEGCCMYKHLDKVNGDSFCNKSIKLNDKQRLGKVSNILCGTHKNVYIKKRKGKGKCIWMNTKFVCNEDYTNLSYLCNKHDTMLIEYLCNLVNNKLKIDNSITVKDVNIKKELHDITQFSIKFKQDQQDIKNEVEDNTTKVMLMIDKMKLESSNRGI
jgi:hypothetical protein